MMHYCFHTDIGFYRLKSVVKTLPLHEKSKPVLPLVVESNLRMKYNAIQYNTIQYNTIQYNTIQYNTIQYNTIQYNIKTYYAPYVT